MKLERYKINLIFFMVVCWAIDVSTWKPEAEEWDKKISSIQAEEQARVSKFIFEMDRKRALLGRLLIRRLVSSVFGIEEFTLGRTCNGKPELTCPAQGALSFNISHHGNWVVIVGDESACVGVDVMSYDVPRGSKSIDDFFRMMNSSFTPREWAQIKIHEKAEMEDLKRFYQLWSLKESYIKAIGVGIGFGLQRVSFTLDDKQLPCTALLHVDGELACDWTFDVQELDSEHCVSVAMQSKTNSIRWEILVDI